MDDDPGLARAGPGQHEQRPVAVQDRLALGVVQGVEDGVGTAHGGCTIPRATRGSRHARAAVDWPDGLPRPHRRAGRPRRDRHELPGDRVRGPHRRGRLRAALPGRALRRRGHLPRPLLAAGAARPGGRGPPHPRSRGPPGGAAAPAARRPGAGLRAAARAGPAAGPARGGGRARRPARGAGRARWSGPGDGSPFTRRVRRRGPLHPRRLRAGHRHAAGGRLPLGRLQDRRGARSTAGAPTSPASRPWGGTGIRLLLSDSTNAERPGSSLSESEVGPALRGAMDGAPGRVWVACFSSHLHRIQQVADAGRALGRRLVPLGRSHGGERPARPGAGVPPARPRAARDRRGGPRPPAAGDVHRRHRHAG